jgi:uncharacterized protein
MTRKSDKRMELLTLRWLPGRYAICRLGPHEVIPPWAVNSSGFMNVTRTADELSVIVLEEAVPPHVQHQGGYAVMGIAGKLDFNLTGVIATLTTALADAGIPVLTVSTYDTDYLLVKAGKMAAAKRALAGVARFEKAG